MTRLKASGNASRQFGSVVGLDLSLAATGFACTYPGDARAWTDLVESKGTKTATWDDRWQRLRKLARDITDLIPDDNPLIVIEAPAYSSTTGSAMDRHGLWWLIYDTLAEQGHWVITVPPPNRAKYATGRGNAGKDAVLAAAVRRYPAIDINDNNIADAVILMAIGCRLLGEPIDEPLPATNLAALERLWLPDGIARAS